MDRRQVSTMISDHMASMLEALLKQVTRIHSMISDIWENRIDGTQVSVMIIDRMASMLEAIMERVTRTGELRSRITAYLPDRSSEYTMVEKTGEDATDTISAPPEFPDSPFDQPFQESPEVPEVPEVPEAPEVPEVPEVSEVPEVPDAPPQVQQDISKDISDDIDAIKKDVIEVRAQTDEIKTVFSALTEAVYYMPVPKEGNEPILSDINDLKQHLKTIDANVSKSGVTVVTADARLNDMISRVSGIEQTTSEIISKHGEVSEKLDELPGLIASNRSKIENLAANNERIDGMYGTLDDMHSIISSLTDDVRNIIETIEEGSAEDATDGEVTDVEIMPPNVCVKLDTIGNEADKVKITMEMLELLIELVGSNNMPSILDYYVEIGWISENARLELLAYASGMDYHDEKANWKLSTDDHLKILWFIEQLCGHKINKNRLFCVDREISKVRKGIDVLYEI